MESRTLLDSLRHALRGLWQGLRTQRNIRIHVVLGTLAISLGLILRLSAVEMALVVAFIALVIAAELLNTALEVLVNIASPEYHPLAKQAKDLAAAAVLVTALGALVGGALIFLPHLIS